MSDERQPDFPSTTLNFGAGVTRASATFRGPIALIKEQVAESVGIKAHETLAETLVAASLDTHDLVTRHLLSIGTGAEQQETPPPPAEAEAAPAEKPKRSGRGKAKKEPEKVREPEPADDVADAFKGAQSLEELRELWAAAKNAGTLNKEVHEPVFKAVAIEKGWVK